MKDQSVRSGFYRQSDIRAVFSHGDWEDWDEAIEWLEENGDSDNELTLVEVEAMMEDFQTLQEQGVPFSSDADVVFEEINKYQSS